MSSPDYEALRVALRTRLATANGYPGHSKVQWENVPFNPPASDGSGGLWLREHMVPGSESVTSSGMVTGLGLYYVYVNGPAGQGSKPVQDLARAVLAVFSPATSLASPPTHIYRSERLPARLDGTGVSGQAQAVWYSVPVVVYWRTFHAFQ